MARVTACEKELAIRSSQLPGRQTFVTYKSSRHHHQHEVQKSNPLWLREVQRDSDAGFRVSESDQTRFVGLFESTKRSATFSIEKVGQSRLGI